MRTACGIGCCPACGESAASSRHWTSVVAFNRGDEYLNTMGIPLVRGRGFTAENGVGAEPVTIVSKALADRLVPGGDVIGKTLMFGADPRRSRR